MLTGDARDMAKTGERQVILDELAEAGGKALTTGQPAKAVGKKPDNVSHLLKRLKDEGLVQNPEYARWKLSDPHSERSKRSNWNDADNPEGDED